MSSFIRFTYRRFQTRFLLLLLVACVAAVAMVLKSGPFDRAAHARTTAAFTPGNLVVYRVGDGSAALTTAATAVFLDEYSTAGGLAQSIPLPTTVNGTQKRLTASGLSTSEGLMTLSTDGQYLTAAGYDAAPGTASITGSASTTINRVIGRINAGGTVDTTTALTDAISGGNPRGAVSTNGTDLWLSGTSAGGGIRYATFGSTSSTSLAATPTNIRATNIFGGQLYVSSMSGAFRLATVGTGTPTTSGQTVANLPGFPSTGSPNSPYAFFFADLDGGVAGVDTVYVADDAAGQIQKYSLVAGSWTARGAITATAVRGLTGVVNGSTVTLYATGADLLMNPTAYFIYTATDATGYNVNATGAVTTIATAATNTAFRGVAFVPVATSTPTLNVSDVTQVETDAGTTTFTFNVSLTSPAGVSGVTFDIATADGTAQDGNPGGEDSDYVAKTELGRTITSGNTSATFTVTVNGDVTDEPSETFFVNVTNVSGATTGDGQGLGTITNDDGPPALSINDVTQAEGNAGTTNFTFTIGLNKPAQAGGVSFTVNTADGTTNPANAGSDYVAIVGGSGSITVGNTSTNVVVQVNGDGTTEPNETFFVNLTSVVGATVSDGQGLGTISNDDVTLVPIHTIQGSGFASPFSGTSVSTTGIVTGRKTNGFFIQDPNPDGDVNTSEGIFVFTSSAPAAGIAVGDSVQVTGTVTEFESSTTDEPDGVSPPDPKTATEIITPTTLVLTSGNPLPAALDAASLNIFDPTAASRGAQLEKYEYMRVSVGSITVSEPTNNFAEFWGVMTSVPRPFREPGIERGDPIPAADEGAFAGSPPPNPPIFDGNFERIQVDSDDATNTANARRPVVNVTTGAIVTGIVGPLDYAFDSYRIVLDFTEAPGITPGITAAVPVPIPAADEFTVGHANLENFSSSNANRMNKASLAIRNVMRTPDILGIIEVDTAASATALANKVNADAASPNVNYVAYFSETSGPQDIGYLVNSARVTVVGTPTQYHAGMTFPYCGANDILHDRPSFVLTATLPQVGGGIIPVTAILNHTKSLIAVDSPRPYGTCGTGTEGARNREKRRRQAEDLADLIQLHMSDNLVFLGDLNAFDFNDGLGDIVGTLRGTPAPADQVVEPSTDRWPYVITNLLYTVPAAEQYSLLFEGNAQALDHVLINNAMVARNTRFAFGRYNSDFSPDYAADANRPEALSDHDAPIAYFAATPTAADGVVRGRITDPNGVPIAGAVVNLSGTQNRKFITDANGNYRFEGVETTGFYTVRPSLLNYSFNPVERSFSQIGNSTEAAFTGARSGGFGNPLDTPEYFVRQHYLDFLGREPDESGFNFWSDQMLECGSDAGCFERRRINVSAAYFLSIEFQQTGGLVDGLYRASYGRAPRYAEFMPDARTIARDVIVGRAGWVQQLETNKQAFINDWIQRAAFRAAYDGLANAAFVDTLVSHTGGGFNGSRDALISGLNSGSLNRAAVLRQVVENEGFINAKRNEAFVMMEYLGYLRRDPDASGYAFWLNKLREFDGNFERAEMVKAFLVSGEYRARFSN